jgi:hypothetical protein
VNIALAKLPFLTESQQQQFFKIAIYYNWTKKIIVDNGLEWDSQIAIILFNCSDRETYDL